MSIPRKCILCNGRRELVAVDRGEFRDFRIYDPNSPRTEKFIERRFPCPACCEMMPLEHIAIAEASQSVIVDSGMVDDELNLIATSECISNIVRRIIENRHYSICWRNTGDDIMTCTIRIGIAPVDRINDISVAREKIAADAISSERDRMRLEVMNALHRARNEHQSFAWFASEIVQKLFDPEEALTR